MNKREEDFRGHIFYFMTNLNHNCTHGDKFRIFLSDYPTQYFCF